MTRTWTLYGQRHATKRTPKGEPAISDVHDFKEALLFSGVPRNKIVNVQFVEDADGEYLGWLDKEEPERLTMVELAVIFSIQFPYGVEEAVANGDGEVVRVTPIVLDFND